MSKESTVSLPEPGSKSSPQARFSRPVIVDLGTQSRKKIKDLKAGEGELLDEVRDTLEKVADHIPAEGDNLYQPVVILYERKPRKTQNSLLPFLPIA